MTRRRAQLTLLAGPHRGDTLSIEQGTCRLIGRHLAESETALIDRAGNRVLDGATHAVLTEHLKSHGHSETSPAADMSTFDATAFERGPDIIFADDAISRAHAMIFCDASGPGIIDLASTNGTFVNEKRVESVLMAHGDVLVLGGSALAVKITSQP